ncbi:MAG TPA: polysaccharide deacetylase family protein [Bacteroidales bacterium]|nr:polysaccharide deacetylase family protein [Bacteroidales bacterium]HPJ58386.1 polysaccharide deacetylase family protein [Bacteroidales bacterium]HPR10808.1 polysaccharide deacetylase family protein [Bacteroidales bacterium]HRW85991.1 polysaccharide deacetylase family protein [Bacteroidales bacterium]
MLKYRTISVIFIILIAALAIADLFLSVSLLLYAGIIIAYTALLAWGSADISSGMYVKALCRGNMEKRTIALTFDDGPDIRVTPALLDLLAANNIKAAFFVTGKNAEKHPDIIRRIDRDGHIIGAHSWSHSIFYDLFSRSSMLAEIEKTEELTGSLINKKLKLFRPPFGVTNPPLADVLRHKNYHVIGWSLRSLDTAIKDENRLFSRITARIKQGDIILLHDTMEKTVNVTEKFIKFAAQNEFSFERLDNHLGIEAYEKN